MVARSGVVKSRCPYKNICFSPLGGLKRSDSKGRRGSGDGLRRRAGLGRTRGMVVVVVVLMMALAAFMFGYVPGFEDMGRI